MLVTENTEALVSCLRAFCGLRGVADEAVAVCGGEAFRSTLWAGQQGPAISVALAPKHKDTKRDMFFTQKHLIFNVLMMATMSLY